MVIQLRNSTGLVDAELMRADCLSMPGLIMPSLKARVSGVSRATH